MVLRQYNFHETVAYTLTAQIGYVVRCPQQHVNNAIDNMNYSFESNEICTAAGMFYLQLFKLNEPAFL